MLLSCLFLVVTINEKIYRLYIFLSLVKETIKMRKNICYIYEKVTSRNTISLIF